MVPGRLAEEQFPSTDKKKKCTPPGTTDPGSVEKTDETHHTLRKSCSYGSVYATDIICGCGS